MVLNKILSAEDHCLLGCTATLDGQQYTNIEVEPAASTPKTAVPILVTAVRIWDRAQSVLLFWQSTLRIRLFAPSKHTGPTAIHSAAGFVILLVF
jgi:hypothetical protein